MKLSLRNKLIAFFIIISTLPFLIGGLLGVYYIYRLQYDNILSFNREISRSAAISIEQFIERQFEILNSITYIYYDFSVDNKLQDIMLDRFLHKAGEFIDLAIVNSEGKEIARKNFIQVIAKEDLIDRKNSNEFLIVQKNGSYIGPVILKEGRLLLTLGKAIFNIDGFFQGAIFAQVDGRIMQGAIQNILRERRIKNSYIVNEKGIVIVHPDVSQVLTEKDLSYISIISAVVKNGTVKESLLTDEYQNEKKEAVIGTITPIQFQVLANIPSVFGKETKFFTETETRWWIVVEQVISEAFSRTYRILKLTILILIGWLVLSILIALLLARHIIRPIEKLHYASLELKMGNFDYRVILKTNDELQDLANSLNAMAEALKLSEEKLKKSAWENIQRLEIQLKTLEEKNYNLEMVRNHLEEKLRQYI